MRPLSLVLAALFVSVPLGCLSTTEDPHLDAAQNAIKGGKPDTTPAHAAIVEIESMKDAQGTYSRCTGTIFHVDGGFGWLLTAAHCVNDPAYPPAIVNVGDDSKSPSHSYSVVSYVADPQYDTMTHDFGIVKFADADCATTPTLSLLGPTDDTLAKGMDVDFVGYGVTTDDTHNTLRSHTTGTIAALDDLTLSYDLSSGGPCLGDSGGPSLSMVGTSQVVSGVTSFGDANCVMTGVSGRVSAAISWIDQVAGTNGAGGGCNGGGGSGGSGGSGASLCQGRDSWLCDPVGFTPCDVDGSACDLDPKTGFACFPPPSKLAIGAACNDGVAPYCAQGAHCHGGLCTQYCCKTSDCTDGGVCQPTTESGATFGLCIVPSTTGGGGSGSGGSTGVGGAVNTGGAPDEERVDTSSGCHIEARQRVSFPFALVAFVALGAALSRKRSRRSLAP